MKAALEAYKAIPPTDPKAPMAAVQIRELQGKLDRLGRGEGSDAAAGQIRDGGQGGTDAGGAGTGGSASIAGKLQSAFGLRGRSPTLSRVIDKAAHGRAASFADLERAGIRFEMGAKGQKDAVQLSERDGKQVLTLSPSVFASGKNERVAAQMGRGLEEAATQRDYEGVSEWLRKVGGRLVAVKVLIEVAVGDAGIVRTPGADQRLLDDRAAVEKSKAMSGEIQLGAFPDSIKYITAYSQAANEGFKTPLNIFLYFGAETEGDKFSPKNMRDADKPYILTLHGNMP